MFRGLFCYNVAAVFTSKIPPKGATNFQNEGELMDIRRQLHLYVKTLGLYTGHRRRPEGVVAVQRLLWFLFRSTFNRIHF